ncbi:MAG: helix-turn-helix transcriptional regulator, partial [Rhodospirillales bacterium]|nr:helix-turn-helix transcriptional regulator [Rhodospirillales bacterium]
QAAERLLGARDGIYPWQGTLQASLPHDAARIRDLVSAALPRLGHLPVGGSLSVQRSASLPLVVHVHPVTPLRADFGAERLAALVLIRDPDANRLDPEVVGEVLGLTPAESRVAVLLATGRSVREIARELGRSEHTARWTLKKVLAKTDTSRQSELVRLLLQLSPGDGRG